MKFRGQEFKETKMQKDTKVDSYNNGHKQLSNCYANAMEGSILMLGLVFVCWLLFIK